jgi:hypothetical protein
MNEEIEANMTLVQRVREALKAATEGDYDVSVQAYTDFDLACDLMAYETSVETETFENVLKAVKEVRYGKMGG